MIDHPGIEFNLGRAQIDVLDQSPGGVGCAYSYATKSGHSIEDGVALKDVYAVTYVERNHPWDGWID